GPRSASRCFARARSAPLVPALALDALHRPRNRLETRRVDRPAARLADPVGALVQPRERPVDRDEHVGGVLLERARHLAIERDGCDVAEMVVLEGQLLGLVAHRPRVLVVDVLDRLENGTPLLLEPLTEMLGVDGAIAVPASRSSAS